MWAETATDRAWSAVGNCLPLLLVDEQTLELWVQRGSGDVVLDYLEAVN